MANEKTKRMVLESVQTTVPVTVFGNSTNKFSATMQHLSLRADGRDVVVTSQLFPGKEERIHAGAIAKTSWREVE